MTKKFSRTLTISGLTRIKVESYFEKFGETGWLDCEEKILIDVKSLNEHEISKYNMFFGIDAIDFDWIVVDLKDFTRHLD